MLLHKHCHDLALVKSVVIAHPYLVGFRFLIIIKTLCCSQFAVSFIQCEPLVIVPTYDGELDLRIDIFVSVCCIDCCNQCTNCCIL